MSNHALSGPTSFLDRLSLYQSANSSPEVIKRNFLIRIAEFELITAELRRKKPADPVQHELILGRRGSGKSTLLRRIQIEIDEDTDLASRYIAINLAEEQASIYRLSDLWFEVLHELQLRFGKAPKLRDFDDFEDNSAYTRYLYAEIHQLLQGSGKRVVLLLDNLDRILENFDDDGNLLRETLLNYNDLQIIGGSTRMDEHFWQYDKPFYEFFRRHRLEGLQFEEIHRLLNHWSAEMDLPVLHDYALQYRGRIEAIRILTDGLPRALQVFIQLLLHDAKQFGFDYLRKVMDNASPLYQERLNTLTAAQRKIVQEMAFWWEAAPTKVLVEKCRMESKLIASYLRQLEQYGIVETIATGKKNHLYRISERFFNMWLIVTQGNPDQKRRAKYLTHFLESWYDATELKDLTTQHLTALGSGQLRYDKAFVLSKGLSQSKYISTQERDALIDKTLALQQEMGLDSELPRKYSEIKAEIDQLWDENRYEAALKKIDEIENEADGVKFFLQAYCYHELKKYKEAESHYLQAIKKGNVDALNNLAILYRDQGKKAESESYYLQAIEKGHVNALYNLANLYRDQGKKAESESYYLQAIEKGHVDALYNLANLYREQGKNAESESYYLQAIEKGHVDALNNLANLYSEQGKNAESESWYLKSIEKGDINALYNLANLYREQGKNTESESWYLKSIEKGHVNALNNLAILYYSTNQQAPQALEYIRAYYAQSGDKSRYQHVVLVEIWNGIMDGLPEKIAHVLEISAGEYLEAFFTDLLCLEQKHLVLSLFESAAHGKMLKSRYELIYYATLILTNKTEDNLLLRIPPEVLPTVHEIVEKVKQSGKFGLV